MALISVASLILIHLDFVVLFTFEMCFPLQFHMCALFCSSNERISVVCFWFLRSRHLPTAHANVYPISWREKKKNLNWSVAIEKSYENVRDFLVLIAARFFCLSRIHNFFHFILFHFIRMCLCSDYGDLLSLFHANKPHINVKVTDWI